MVSKNDIKTEEDIQNMEHLGEWDHGVQEPASGDVKEHPVVQDPLTSAKNLIKQAQTAVVKVAHDLSEKADDAIHKDSHFKEEVEGHTEEEVAGMKLCVSKTVHQDSFSAQC